MNIQNPLARRALVAIDPGRNLGWSVFVQTGVILRENTPIPPVQPPGVGWELRACGLVSCASTNVSIQTQETRAAVQTAILRVLWDNGFHPGQHPLSVCELMEWRPDDRRSSAQDLIRVATVGAAIAGMLSPEPWFVTPNEWKGQVPKEIMGSRVLHALVPAEGLVFTRDSRGITPNAAHNIVDAIGIGLWAVGRIQRGGGQ